MKKEIKKWWNQGRTLLGYDDEDVPMWSLCNGEWCTFGITVCVMAAILIAVFIIAK